MGEPGDPGAGNGLDDGRHGELGQTIEIASPIDRLAQLFRLAVRNQCIDAIVDGYERDIEVALRTVPGARVTLGCRVGFQPRNLAVECFVVGGSSTELR